MIRLYIGKMKHYIIIYIIDIEEGQKMKKKNNNFIAAAINKKALKKALSDEKSRKEFNV